MIGLSTHVLDLGRGRPARGVRVVLQRADADGWAQIGEGVTDDDGRIGELGVGLAPGLHRLVFETGAAGNRFFPEVHLVVDLEETQGHYHVPLLLSPFGYTTYRGS